MSNRRRYYPQRNNDLNAVLRDALLEALGVSVPAAPPSSAHGSGTFSGAARDDSFEQILWYDDEPLPPPQEMEGASLPYEHLEGAGNTEDRSMRETPAAQSALTFSQFNWRAAVIAREVLGPPRCRARRVR